MRNRRALFSVLFVSSSLIASAFIVACKDDTPSEFTDPKNDGGNVPDRVQGFVTDTGKPFEGSVKVDCKPSLPTDFKPTFTPPVKKEACTADQIKTYYDDCLPTKLDEQSCKDWLVANTDCGKCIEAPEQKGPIQVYAVGDTERYFYTLNNAGCIGLVQNKTGDDSCAKAYDTTVNCARAACIACFAKGGEYDDFSECQGAALESNACKGFDTTTNEKCTNLDDADGGAPQCLGASKSDADQKALYTRLANAFCLKP